MGLLRMLAFPLTGPMWVAGVLRDEAERQFYDVEAIRRQMMALEQERRLGQIDEQTFGEREEALLQRLIDARENHRRRRRQE